MQWLGFLIDGAIGIGLCVLFLAITIIAVHDWRKIARKIARKTPPRGAGDQPFPRKR
jgi:hypothetical protein